MCLSNLFLVGRAPKFTQVMLLLRFVNEISLLQNCKINKFFDIIETSCRVTK